MKPGTRHIYLTISDHIGLLDAIPMATAPLCRLWLVPLIVCSKSGSHPCGKRWGANCTMETEVTWSRFISLVVNAFSWLRHTIGHITSFTAGCASHSLNIVIQRKDSQIKLRKQNVGRVSMPSIVQECLVGSVYWLPRHDLFQHRGVSRPQLSLLPNEEASWEVNYWLLTHGFSFSTWCCSCRAGHGDFQWDPKFWSFSRGLDSALRPENDASQTFNSPGIFGPKEQVASVHDQFVTLWVWQ